MVELGRWVLGCGLQMSGEVGALGCAGSCASRDQPPASGLEAWWGRSSEEIMPPDRTLVPMNNTCARQQHSAPSPPITHAPSLPPPLPLPHRSTPRASPAARSAPSAAPPRHQPPPPQSPPPAQLPPASPRPPDGCWWRRTTRWTCGSWRKLRPPGQTTGHRRSTTTEDRCVG